LSSPAEHADARDNIVYLQAAAGGMLSLMDTDGTLDWSHNWVEPGWAVSFGTFQGSVADDGTSIQGAAPGFAGEASEDFHLAAGSPCVNAGAPLPAAVLPANDLLRQ